MYCKLVLFALCMAVCCAFPRGSGQRQHRLPFEGGYGGPANRGVSTNREPESLKVYRNGAPVHNRQDYIDHYHVHPVGPSIKQDYQQHEKLTTHQGPPEQPSYKASYRGTIVVVNSGKRRRQN